MLVITVEFRLHAGASATFLPLAAENARLSCEKEKGCRIFDVCVDSEDPEFVFLYEIYDDEVAFNAHLSSPHFKAFDVATRDMVAGKLVRRLQKVM